MNRKCRIFVISMVCLLGLFTACSNPNNDTNTESDNGRTLWQETKNGYTGKVILTEGVEDGMKAKGLSYTIQENSSGKRMGFGIVKLEANGNVLYKGAIMAERKSEPFTNLYWTNYQISCGQNSIIMSNALGAPSEENGYYQFMILGGISEVQLTALKNANVLLISLTNSSDSTRNTTFSCDFNFITNLIKYF